MTQRTARIEVYMKAGTMGLSTNGAIVRVKDHKTVHSGVLTRLTGGTVVELEVNTYFMYEFNVAGEGRFTLAIRPDRDEIDLEHEGFDSLYAKTGPHSCRSFAFKVNG